MLLSCAVLILATIQHAQATSFFSGQVIDSQNKPVVGAVVQAGYVALEFGEWTYKIDGQATTGSDGNYSITTLDSANTSGQYVLAAQRPGYLITVYPNLHCASVACLGNQSLPVYAPQSGVNFSLLQSASISGKLTRADSSAALPSKAINLIGMDGHVAAEADTDTSGNYKFDGLLPGSYAVTFGLSGAGDVAPLLPQIYAQHDFDATMLGSDFSNLLVIGDTIALQEGQAASNINFALHAGVSISGTITSASNGAPAYASPYLLRQDVALTGMSYVFPGLQSSDANGNYVIGPLAPGSFFIHFQSNDQYFPLFYGQASTQNQAQLVTVSSAANAVGINAQLTPERSIAGTVIDAVTQQPIAGAIVHAGRLGLSFLGDSADATTDASGHYFLQGLDSNSYYLWTDGAPGYQPQFYANAIPCCDDPALAGATAHALGSAEHATGMNFSLQKGAYGSGRIYDPATNAGLAGAYVQLYDSTGKPVGPINGFGYPVSPVSTAAGNFNTAAVPTGNYYLAMTYASKTILYPNVPCTVSAGCNFAQAQLLHFSAAQQYPNLDFAIAHLDQIFHGGFDQ